MAYRDLVNKNLITAFKSLKDLVENAVFMKKTDSSFDFSTGEASAVNVNQVAEIIVLRTVREKPNTLKRKILVRIKESGGLNSFDTVQIRTDTWKIGTSTDIADFIYLLDVYKEV